MSYFEKNCVRNKQNRANRQKTKKNKDVHCVDNMVLSKAVISGPIARINNNFNIPPVQNVIHDQ